MELVPSCKGEISMMFLTALLDTGELNLAKDIEKDLNEQFLKDTDVKVHIKRLTRSSMSGSFDTRFALTFTKPEDDDIKKETKTKDSIKESIVVTDNKGELGKFLLKQKKIAAWKHIFEQIDGEIEVTKIEESNDQKTCTVCYLMPYSEIQNTYSFDIDSEVQDAIDGFCAKVKERAHEMIFHINECANSVEDYFNMEE